MTPDAALILSDVQAWHWLALGLAMTAPVALWRQRVWIWPSIGAWTTGLVMLFAPMRWDGQILLCLITASAAYIAARFILPRGR